MTKQAIACMYLKLLVLVRLWSPSWVLFYLRKRVFTDFACMCLMIFVCLAFLLSRDKCRCRCTLIFDRLL